MDYKKAGVDIVAGQKAVDRIKSAVESTHNENVLSGLGAFGGFFRIDTDKWKEPVLISSTDGVGTKILVAKLAGNYSTIGMDLVNHCVNDIFVHNAQPLFFLDYIGTGKLYPAKMADIVKGMVIACNNHEMALIGGEMAEMPDLYDKDDVDLVGTIVGCTERSRVINGETIEENDVVIGFASSGLHTNGYTLARRILFEKKQHDIDNYIAELGKTLGEELLTPHKSYYSQLRNYAMNETRMINGMAHITGSGIAGNLQRIIPDGLCADIDTTSWKPQPVFSYLQKEGNVPVAEMFSAFNMGIGFIAVVNEQWADVFVEGCSGIVIGSIAKQECINSPKVRLLNI